MRLLFFVLFLSLATRWTYKYYGMNYHREGQRPLQSAIRTNNRPPQSENVFTEIPTSGSPDTALYNALDSTEGISNQDYSGFGGRKVKPLVFMYLHLCGFWKH